MNWAEGVLRVRGIQLDVKKFIVEAIRPYKVEPTMAERLEIDEFDTVSTSIPCGIKTIMAGFVNDINIEFYRNDDDIITIAINTAFPGSVPADNLATLSSRYKVDFRIYAFEKGKEFNQYVEILQGKIISDKKITFKDYDWDCINPLLGG